MMKSSLAIESVKLLCVLKLNDYVAVAVMRFCVLLPPANFSVNFAVVVVVVMRERTPTGAVTNWCRI